MGKFDASEIKNLEGKLIFLIQENNQIPQLSYLDIFERYGIYFQSMHIYHSFQEVKNQDFVLIVGDNNFLKDASLKLSKLNIKYDYFNNWFSKEIDILALILMGYYEYKDIYNNKILVSTHISFGISVERVCNNYEILNKNNTIRIGKLATAKKPCKIVLGGENAYVHIEDDVVLDDAEIFVETEGRIILKKGMELRGGAIRANNNWHIFNLIGSCVSRDTFELPNNDFMKIQSYIGRNSIISSAYPPINIKTEEKKIKNNWENRMVVCDIEKRMLDILSQKKSQWLLVDLIDERFGLLEVKVGKLTSYVTYSQVLKRSEYIKQIAEKGNYEVIDQDEIDEYTVQSIFSRFCKEILSLYDANHIIINKTYPVKYYISHDGKIKAFDNEVSIEKYRRRLERYYHMLEKNWNGCHVIEMPSNTIGDENHKWGLASTHFTQDYYENLLQEIRKIVYS